MSEGKNTPEDVVAFRADEADGIDEAGGTDFTTKVQGSTLAANAQGPGAQAHGTVNNYGLGYSDVRAIVDERLTAALEGLRVAVGHAHDRSMQDMLQVSFAVVQSLVAVKLGTQPDAASVADFLQAAVEDPAFPARAARLFQEGAKTPSAARREMLARALFGIPTTTLEIDRIDTAVERLFPSDVKLLADLIRFSLPYLLVAEGPETDAKPFIVRSEDRNDMLVSQSMPQAQLVCDAYALYNLHAVGCVKIDGRVAGFGPEGRYVTSVLFILPLGHAVLKALVSAGQRNLEVEESP